MISRKRPTADQQRWQDWLRSQGCAICGSPASIHHAVGATGKHDKVEIGQWWTLNLCYDHHQSAGGIHGDLSAFDLYDVQRWGETRKEIEKVIFAEYAAKYEQDGGLIPDDVKAAIGDFHR